jgi:hypothetical protein
MRGAIPPLHYVPSWHVQGFTFYEYEIYYISMLLSVPARVVRCRKNRQNSPLRSANATGVISIFKYDVVYSLCASQLHIVMKFVTVLNDL